jgi:hypothetical protein
MVRTPCVPETAIFLPVLFSTGYGENSLHSAKLALRFSKKPFRIGLSNIYRGGCCDKRLIRFDGCFRALAPVATTTRGPHGSVISAYRVIPSPKGRSPQPAECNRAHGKPVAGWRKGEPMFKRQFFTTSMRLASTHSKWLNDIRMTILDRHGKHMDRSSLLRSLLDGLVGMDLADCSTPQQVTRAVRSSWRGNGSGDSGRGRRLGTGSVAATGRRSRREVAAL